MKISKSMLAAGAVTTVAVASLAGIGTASAQSNNARGNGLVDRIATTFGLNREEVQTVFDEQKTEMKAQREEKRAEHLQELVDNGTITAEQKSALETRKEEMNTIREALKDQDLTREEMHTQMEKAHADFEAWSEEQGINLDAIRPEGGAKRGYHGGMMKEDSNN